MSSYHYPTNLIPVKTQNFPHHPVSSAPHPWRVGCSGKSQVQLRNTCRGLLWIRIVQTHSSPCLAPAAHGRFRAEVVSSRTELLDVSLCRIHQQPTRHPRRALLSPPPPHDASSDATRQDSCSGWNWPPCASESEAWLLGPQQPKRCRAHLQSPAPQLPLRHTVLLVHMQPVISNTVCE